MEGINSHEGVGRMARSYAEVQQLTEEEQFEVARTEYRQIVDSDPSLAADPGEAARIIQQNTGLDFETAAIVSLSASS